MKYWSHLAKYKAPFPNFPYSIRNFYHFRLFLNGVPIPIDKMYPTIQFPVSRGTPMIAPLIKWDHQEDYMVAKFDASKDITSERKVTINIKDEDHQYMKGHVIDGMIEFTFYHFFFVYPGIFFARKCILFIAFVFQPFSHSSVTLNEL